MIDVDYLRFRAGQLLDPPVPDQQPALLRARQHEVVDDAFCISPGTADEHRGEGVQERQPDEVQAW